MRANLTISIMAPTAWGQLAALCIFGGLVAGKRFRAIWMRSLPPSRISLAYISKQLWKRSADQKRAARAQRPGKCACSASRIGAMDGLNVTVKRNDARLDAHHSKNHELQERYKSISLDDRCQFANQTYAFANQFGAMLDLSLIIAKGALLRDDSAARTKSQNYPQGMIDIGSKRPLRLTTPSSKSLSFSYEPVDLRYLKPIARDYTKARKEVKPKLENIPDNIPLPI